jgi:hypothetical protein
MLNRILFVRRPSPKKGVKSTEALVMDKLAEEYRVAIALTNGLDDQIWDVFPDALFSRDPIVAMITPVPPNQKIVERQPDKTKYEHCKNNYSQSLQLLSRINRAYPKMPIIAYTQAEKCDEIEQLFQTEGKVKRVVHISPVNKWQDDYVDIKFALYEFIK